MPVNGIIILMPPERPSIEIGGVVKYSDGAPARGATVGFSSNEENKGSSVEVAKTDRNGHFTLKVLKGVVGSILVLESSDSTAENGCDESSRIKKDPTTGYTEFVTIKNVEVNTRKSVPGLVLTFPFASCQKP